MDIPRKPRNRIALRASNFFGRGFFAVLYRVNNRIYMRSYPYFLKWLGVRVEGRPVYIATSVSFDPSDYSLITIRHGCVVSSEVRLLTHDYSVSRVAVAMGMSLAHEFRFIKGIDIGKNAFIGARSIIMPGVKIGDNAIVGAGSVVTRSVEAGEIVAGNPARRISTIQEYWEKTMKSGDDLYSE